ncbi:MAG: D-aminoacyl-tRNA deacylase [Polyangiaceae bacterium]|nr:D-aminoacyl-tRNA deacylase [Polyangiaceae bacterium]
MRAVVQRVNCARVEVDGCVVGEIGRGLTAFIGAGAGDTENDARVIVSKLVGLRVFPDLQDKMSLSIADVQGSVLAISQFTVFGDVRRGRRPSFDGAMEPVEAQRLFDMVVGGIRDMGINVETGRFRAMMRVLVDNDGPVTILIDSRKVF